LDAVSLPKPEPGLVIRYSYLWRAEHLRGQEEGVKDRPCAIVLAPERVEDDTLVVVLPVTHSRRIKASSRLKSRWPLNDRWVSTPNVRGSCYPRAIAFVGLVLI